MTKAKIMETLSQLAAPYEATVWLKTENKKLNNETPAKLILEGRDIEKVQVAIEFDFREKIEKRRK